MGKLENDTKSYMKFRFHQDQGKTYELRVPTFWDSVNKRWLGAIKMPSDSKLFAAWGKDNNELEQNMLKEMHKIISHEKYGDEVFGMMIEVKD